MLCLGVGIEAAVFPTHEGTLRRHINVLGRWEDIEVFALWRGDFVFNIEKRGKLDVSFFRETVRRQSGRFRMKGLT